VLTIGASNVKDAAATEPTSAVVVSAVAKRATVFWYASVLTAHTTAVADTHEEEAHTLLPIRRPTLTSEFAKFRPRTVMLEPMLYGRLSTSDVSVGESKLTDRIARLPTMGPTETVTNELR
jgi:hypothetical protein